MLQDPNCQYRIAKCLENGELGKQQNAVGSVKWYTMAAQLGQVDSQLKLFGYYSFGIPGIVQRDLSSSYFWALKAGAKG